MNLPEIKGCPTAKACKHEIVDAWPCWYHVGNGCEELMFSCGRIGHR
jgi:hypothetical protein